MLRVSSGKKILFVSDEIIWKNCEKFFPENFPENFCAKKLLLKNPKADEKNLKKISAAVKNYDLIITLGSGVINDLCKLTSAQKNIPYAIFASAASMNGYLSKNASITICGHKKTLPATLPIAVFCDLKILAAAPLELTKAGIGDSLCFYSCWLDWYLSHKILGTKFDKKPFEILEKKMNFFVKNFKKFSLRDEKFLKLLMEILLLSGQGMTIAGGSYPASQSEHLIAHVIEMKYPKIAEKFLHGQMIAVTSLTAARLQKNFLNQIFRKAGFVTTSSRSVPNQQDVNMWTGLQTPSSARVSGNYEWKSVEIFFGKKIAAECKKEFVQKIFSAAQLKKINSNLEKNWKKIRADLQKIHLDESRLKEIFSYFKIKISPKSLGLSKQQYQACVANAKFIRNRFTCLDVVNN